jgi:hypothetical protein
MGDTQEIKGMALEIGRNAYLTLKPKMWLSWSPGALQLGGLSYHGHQPLQCAK